MKNFPTVLLCYKYKKSSTATMACIVFLRGFNANIGIFCSNLPMQRLEIHAMKYFLSTFLLLFLISCESDPTNRNPFLQEVGFRFELNLNLPLYNDLNNIGNPVYVDNNGVGTRGAFVMRAGLSGSQFVAWEASCPNHAPNNCSTMTIDGQNVTCSCEDFTYSLFTGQQLDRPDDGNRYYDLLFYRATQSGNIVTIFN